MEEAMVSVMKSTWKILLPSVGIGIWGGVLAYPVIAIFVPSLVSIIGASIAGLIITALVVRSNRGG